MGVASTVPVMSLMSRDGHVLLYTDGCTFAQNPWNIVSARPQSSPNQTAQSHAPSHGQSYKHKSSEFIIPSELVPLPRNRSACEGKTAPSPRPGSVKVGTVDENDPKSPRSIDDAGRINDAFWFIDDWPSRIVTNKRVCVVYTAKLPYHHSGSTIDDDVERAAFHGWYWWYELLHGAILRNNGCSILEVEVDGVDAIVRVRRIPRVVGEAERSQRHLRTPVQCLARCRATAGRPLGLCVHNNARPLVIGALSEGINNVRDRVDQHIAKHNILQ